MNTTKSRKNLSTIAIIAILLLLGINGILLYDRASKDQEISQLKKDLTEVRHLQSELEREYYEALSELDDMRSDNEELNALIDAQKTELTRQRDKISTLIYENRNLEGARRELDNLRVQVDGYIAEIETLYRENEELVMEADRLKREKEILTEEITAERKATDELLALQTNLVQEKEIMDREIRDLARKVERASVIEVGHIDVQGYRLTDGGRERPRRRARNIDVLRICFETSQNDLVEFGDEAFFIRLISPAGETMAIESLGSGIIQDLSDNSQIRFTQMKTIPYSNEVETICSNWSPNMAFTSGKYTVEIYNKGFLAGRSDFELR
ncbi:MAG: hypothetical protein EA409_05350 [Saprospirales bacterium]|nr:MAG: hypothetical protein EA409_05350 [Saprospirales bacterium]